MKIKTYGVPELTEWHGKVKAGTIEVAVSFTGGTSSPSGAQPAYLVTKDPITQFVIENSKEFKNGFIIQLMSQDLPGNHPRMAVAKPKPQAAPKQPATPQPDDKKEEAPVAGETQPDEETVAAEEEGSELTPIEVTCLQDAQAYLQENFNIPSYKVRSFKTVQRTAAENGIRFTGSGFDALDSVDNAGAEV